MKFIAKLTSPHGIVDVGARAAGDLTCSASKSGRTTCRPNGAPTSIDGLDQGACVSLETGTWHAPGLSLHGTRADIRGHRSDPETGQEWAYVGPNEVTVPACVGRRPNPEEAKQIHAVSVGFAPPRATSPAAWRHADSRVYAPGKWYHGRSGQVVKAYKVQGGPFAGRDCVNVDLGGVIVCATICPHDSDAGCNCVAWRS